MDKPKVNLTTLSHEVMNYCSSLKFLKERGLQGLILTGGEDNVNGDVEWNQVVSGQLQRWAMPASETQLGNIPPNILLSSQLINLLNLGKGHTAKTALTHMQVEPDLFLGATGLMSDIVLEHSVGPWVDGECLVTTHFMTEWRCQDLPSLQTQQESMLAGKDQICMRYF
ncbi:hypothetical protein BD769DRAFT_1396223 [Suillus cothurnatus]|nr:hypothetical protein BD769DRAFT_1396223 [Suillus cothurnatus]